MGDEVAIIHISDKETLEAAKDFAAQYGLESPVLLDSDGTVSQLYQLRATPTTFFVNRDGVIEDIAIGFVKLDWIEGKLAQQS